MAGKTGRVAILAAVVLGVVAFFAFDLGQYFALDFLKAQQAAFQDFYARHTWLTLVVFFLVYVLVTALSLPGAAAMTLVGGGLFGLAVGTALVSFASTIGATGAFLVARFLLRDPVQRRFRDRLRAINEGVRKDGPFYLFTLRLIPVFPFFVINLVMGLTPIRTWTFYWVSQLGMLPGTIVYVNAGTQLGQIQSLRGILSLDVLVSFALLGVFPLLAKKGLEGYRRRRVMGRFSKPKRFDYNLVVIGAGSAGLVAAYIAAAVKAKVALIEKHRMGGDCLNTGCVPSKALLRSAKIASHIRRAPEFGLLAPDLEVDFAAIMERVQRLIAKVAPHDSVERYTALGVECISGEARLVSPYEVQVGQRVLTTRAVVIATGAGPQVPELPGLERVDYMTSDTVWALRQRPERLLILGGGPIGCELAQAFCRLGAPVTLVQRGERILDREDEEVSALIQARLTAEGVRVCTRHAAQRVEPAGDGERWHRLVCTTAGGEESLEFDRILVALGRRPNLQGLGLEALGIEISRRGTIEHDPFLRTACPNILVCGDVAGPFQFTHTAAHQAWYAAVNALASPWRKFRADYRVIPACTYTDPEVARVGLNEREAREQGVEYEVTRYGIEDLDRAIVESEDYGFVKVLTEPAKDRILGVTIVGDRAGDIIAEYVAAMKHGFGLNRILSTIHVYPTFAEANKYAAGAWKKAHAPASALAWAQRYHTWRRG